MADKDETPVLIDVSCTGLRKRDTFSQSDPMCVLSTKRGIRGVWKEHGRTKTIKNTNDPEWMKSFNINYYFHQKTNLRFAVYDVDGNSEDLRAHDNLGTAECTLGEILTASKQGENKLEMPLSPYIKEPGDCGVLLVRGEPINDGTKAMITIDLTAENVDKKDLFSDSDPFFTISRMNPDETDTLVYRSEWIKDDANPDWKPVTMTCAKLCNRDYFRELKIEVFDWEKDGGHDFIGECTTTLNQLSQEGESEVQKRYPLINPKKTAKKHYQNSGELIVKSIKIEEDSTFLDYIRGGLKLNFAVAVDMTINNGCPQEPDTNTHINHDNKENAYTTAIRSVGEVIQEYNYDKKFLGVGFGGLVEGRTMHCFHLSGREDNPYCDGIDGLVTSYLNTLQEIAPSYPTRYSNVIDYAAKEAAKLPMGREYLVLLVITGGGLDDLAETKEILVENCNRPFSVVLVGVGDGDMSALVQLDADRARLTSNGRQASRDIVQFVHINTFIPGGKLTPEYFKDVMDPAEAKYKLAKAVLEEIPRQVTECLQKAKVVPGIPDIPGLEDLKI